MGKHIAKSSSLTVVSSTEASIIDKVCNEDYLMVDKWQEGRVPKACDDVNLHLGRVSSVLVESWLAQQVEEKIDLGWDQIAIGSTVGMKPDEVLNHDTDDSDLDEQGSEESVNVIDDLYDLDQVFMSGEEATGGKGVRAQHLSKVWWISHEDAQQMLDVTSQHGNRPVDPQLAKNYGTNDRMLQYKRIKEYFYISTPTKDVDKSPQEVFSSINISPKIKHFHTFACPTYVLDKALQAQHYLPKGQKQAQ